MACNYVDGQGHLDKVHQAGCSQCRGKAWANHVKPNWMIGTIQGGFNDSRDGYRFQSNFDKGLDAYKQARGEGLAPAATTVAAVEKAREQVKSQERALKKMGMKADEIKTVAGVS